MGLALQLEAGGENLGILDVNGFIGKYGGAEGVRTLDLMNAIHALSQTELRPHAVSCYVANASCEKKFRQPARILRQWVTMAQCGVRRSESSGRRAGRSPSPALSRS